MSQEEVKEIDTNLYSRQIGTYGMETMGKLIKLRVLVIGLRGLGVETAKNIILAGPGAVNVFDPSPVELRDLSGNFYCTESDIGARSRGEACITQLKELNPYVKVENLAQAKLDIGAGDYQNYDVIVVTELLMNVDEMIEVDEYCRKNGKAFILCQTLGAAGYTFADFGPDHKIIDENGEECKSFMVTNITQEEKAVVTVHDGKKHSFGEWNHVVFKEVQGMEEINEREPVEISVIDGYSFRLALDTTKFNPYKSEGIVTEKKMPIHKKYRSLKETLLDPVCDDATKMLICPDWRFFGHSEQIHFGVLALLEFHKVNGRLPKLNDEEESKWCLDKADEFNKAQKAKQGSFNVEELDPKVLLPLFNGAAASISPLAAFFGGIIAQEVVKFTGKYSPINQWFHYDTFESLPAAANKAPMNSRYDDQIAIYGQEIQKKLGELNIFMVGAGALGCEYMKAYALMGLGTKSQGGKVTVTDNDNIEVSNLNRQFLFRSNNVGHPKSECASAAAVKMNQDLNPNSMTSLVAPTTEDTFTEEFWDSLDFVVNAVDNIKARLYVDSKCVWHHKALLESGTLGTKANSQMVIPNLTKCYGDTQDPPEDAIAMCTLRNFPNQIEHCIEWARDKFGSKFTNEANDLINYLDNPAGFIKDLKANNTSTVQRMTLESIQQLLECKRNASFDKLIEIARTEFENQFSNTIKQLLHLFPEDHVNEDGQRFWSGPKRCPVPIKFDPNDSLHVSYVASFANLLAFNLKMKQNRDLAHIAKVASGTKVEEFQPKTGIKIQTEENQKVEEEPVFNDEDEEKANKLIATMKGGVKSVNSKSFEAVDFEKDDDQNFHIDFIHAASTLRARNYRIKECDWQRTKFIAGKITPAIATTTAMITGVVCTEIFKVIQKIDKLDVYKNAFINLAIGMFVFSEPDEVTKTVDKDFDPMLLGPIKAIPPNWTIWDKIKIEEPMTLGGFVEKMKNEYSVNLNMLTYGEVTLYSDYFVDAAEAKIRMPMRIEDVYLKVTKKTDLEGLKMMILGIGGDQDGVDVVMPPVCYRFA